MRNYNEYPKVIRGFLSYMITVKGRTQKTVDQYAADLRTFFRYIKCLSTNQDLDDIAEVDIGDMSEKDIDHLSITDLYEYMLYVARTRENGARARARKISCLRSFFGYLHTKVNLIDTNPTEQLESPKLPKNLPGYLTLEESRALLDAVDGEFKLRNYAIVTLFLNCGLRLSELVGINLSEVKPDRLIVTGKGNKQREIYLNNACIEAINGYLSVRPHENVKDRNALFLSKRLRRISHQMVQTLVKKTIERAELDPTKYSCHKLRHTAATLLYNHGGVDVRLLQEILGHEHLSTTEIYTHIDRPRLKQAMDLNPLANESQKK